MSATSPSATVQQWLDDFGAAVERSAELDRTRIARPRIADVKQSLVAPAASDRADPSTSWPRARTISARGNMPLPPMPQKK